MVLSTSYRALSIHRSAFKMARQLCSTLEVGFRDDLSSEFVQKYFSNFEMFKMDAPVRTTAGVAKQIKSRFTKIAQTTEIALNGKLCADLKVPPNLVEGCKTETFGFDGIKPIEELLKLGFDKLPKNAYALIIIDDRHVTR